MARKLRVAIIGAGAIARDMHFPAWKELEQEGRVEVVALSEVKKERATEMGEKFSVPGVHTDYRKMLRSENLDIVDICVHNRLHCQMTVDALRAGAHTMVEKPMAMNVAEAKKMVAAHEKAGRKLMVAQHMRFEAGSRKIREVIESGELGEIYTIRVKWLRRRGIPGWGLFLSAKESGGGPMADIGVHVMDLGMWLMGSPQPVTVSGQVFRKFGDRKDVVNMWGVQWKPKEYEVEDYAQGFVRFDTGQTMTVEVSWAANIGGDEHNIHLLGDKAGAGVFPPEIYGYDSSGLTTRKFDWLPPSKGHREEIRHFCECVEKDKPVIVQPSQSLRVQQVIDGLYESSRKGREVRVR